MKKLILAAITLTSAVSVFAQGTVSFNLRGSGTAHVYLPLNASDTTKIQGNASNDGPQPAGSSVDYAGRAAIGAGGLAQAQSYLSQLLGANGAGAPESSLLPSLSAPTSFRTGTAAGGNAPTTATFGNITPDAAIASFEMVAWDNSSGLYPTWAQASVAWNNGLIAAGRSLEFTLAAIGGGVNTPPPLFPTSGSTTPGLQSFSLYFNIVPEPTSAALLGLGAAAMLIFRRRK
jgi:hypothetical protein